MKVFGYSISDEQYQAAVAVMKGQFTFKQVKQALMDSGVPETIKVNGRHFPEYLVERAGDRILQRERKAGNVVFKNNAWHAVDQGGQKS